MGGLGMTVNQPQLKTAWDDVKCAQILALNQKQVCILYFIFLGDLLLYYAVYLVYYYIGYMIIIQYLPTFSLEKGKPVNFIHKNLS